MLPIWFNIRAYYSRVACSPYGSAFRVSGFGVKVDRASDPPKGEERGVALLHEGPSGVDPAGVHRPSGVDPTGEPRS